MGFNNNHFNKILLLYKHGSITYISSDTSNVILVKTLNYSSLKHFKDIGVGEAKIWVRG